MTDISKLGEFGLIHHLTDNIKTKNESTIKGVGDDCAVLHYPDSEVLVTTDMLMEGVHFDLTYIDMQHLGYKSAMVNISDIFAMNGTPRQLTVSLALSKRFKVEDMEQFYSGLRMACEKWGVDIAGGDTTSSYTGLAISITCIGEARKEDIVYRNGAKDTDLICVTGDLGAACSCSNAKRASTISRWTRLARRTTSVPWNSYATSSPTLQERNICCNASCRLKLVATSLHASANSTSTLLP